MKTITAFIAVMLVVSSVLAATPTSQRVNELGALRREGVRKQREQRMKEIEEEQKKDDLKLRIQAMQRRGETVKAVACYKARIKCIPVQIVYPPGPIRDPREVWRRAATQSLQTETGSIGIGLRFGNHTDYNAKGLVYTIKVIDALGEEVYREQVKDFRPLESWHVEERPRWKYIEDYEIVEELKGPVKNKAVKVLIRLEKVLWENGEVTVLFTPPKSEKEGK